MRGMKLQPDFLDTPTYILLSNPNYVSHSTVAIKRTSHPLIVSEKLSAYTDQDSSKLSNPPCNNFPSSTGVGRHPSLATGGTQHTHTVFAVLHYRRVPSVPCPLSLGRLLSLTRLQATQHAPKAVRQQCRLEIRCVSLGGIFSLPRITPAICYR